ncbi:hypothetical protein JZ751_019948 [Albula glossodonta]|uniref:Uncharacterized protein n=1 Tax=Albula glossodonta TaxID=121402 RepID=A0A8T2MUC1_9TELE|nr:hypothetical protein JZ751_019948 [Albula glossodonta]
MPSCLFTNPPNHLSLSVCVCCSSAWFAVFLCLTLCHILYETRLIRAQTEPAPRERERLLLKPDSASHSVLSSMGWGVTGGRWRGSVHGLFCQSLSPQQHGVGGYGGQVERLCAWFILPVTQSSAAQGGGLQGAGGEALCMVYSASHSVLSSTGWGVTGGRWRGSVHGLFCQSLSPQQHGVGGYGGQVERLCAWFILPVTQSSAAQGGGLQGAGGEALCMVYSASHSVLSSTGWGVTGGRWRGSVHGLFCQSLSPQQHGVGGYGGQVERLCAWFITPSHTLSPPLAEMDKAALGSTVQDLQRQLLATREALSEQQARLGQLSQQLETLQSQQPVPQAQGDQLGALENGSSTAGEYYELEVNGAEVLESRMRAASGEVLRLREELKEVGARYAALEARYRQEKERWRGEAQELAEKIRQCIKASRQDQERIGELEKEIGATRKVAIDSEGHLSVAQEELLAFSEELANLYHHICVCNNLTPSRVTLDYYREGARPAPASRGPHLRKRRSGDLLGKMLQGAGEGAGPDSSGDSSPISPGGGSCPGSPTLDFRDPTNVRNLVAVIRSQMKHLQVRSPSHQSAPALHCPLLPTHPVSFKRNANREHTSQ